MPSSQVLFHCKGQLSSPVVSVLQTPSPLASDLPVAPRTPHPVLHPGGDTVEERLDYCLRCGVPPLQEDWAWIRYRGRHLEVQSAIKA